ncbi:GSCOCG00011934001-RA-CDS [Cotesia congregata]|nr:GSCOCG00011934001-RA-CDS [Cotesia congregata]
MTGHEPAKRDQRGLSTWIICKIIDDGRKTGCRTRQCSSQYITQNVDIGKLDFRRHLWSSKLTTDPAKRGETRNATCAYFLLLPRFRFAACGHVFFFDSEEFAGYFFYFLILRFFLLQRNFGILAFEIYCVDNCGSVFAKNLLRQYDDNWLSPIIYLIKIGPARRQSAV